VAVRCSSWTPVKRKLVVGAQRDLAGRYGTFTVSTSRGQRSGSASTPVLAGIEMRDGIYVSRGRRAPACTTRDRSRASSRRSTSKAPGQGFDRERVSCPRRRFSRDALSRRGTSCFSRARSREGSAYVTQFLSSHEPAAASRRSRQCRLRICSISTGPPMAAVSCTCTILVTGKSD
jgi:hypothetical protein